MIYSNTYLLDYDAMFLLPKYDERGNLIASVMKTNGLFDVNIDPTGLIDFNLRYYGSSLRGARDGAKMILGRGHMNPVIINEKLGIYWFPSKSPSKNDCIWFALHHIREYVEISGKRTKIFFNNGTTLTIDVSRASFDNRVNKAYKLKGKLESRTNETPMQVSESKELYHVARNDKEINFHIITQEE